MMNSPRLKIYHWDVYFLTVGSLKKVPLHSHNAIQIFVSPNSDQRIKVDGIVLSDPLIFVDKNIPHQVLHSGSRQVSLHIEGDSQGANHLSHIYHSQKRLPSILKILEKSFSDPQLVKSELGDLLKSEGCSMCSPHDPRIQRVKSLIDRDEEKKLSLKWLSEQVNLSESRMAHLFKDEVGIPLRKYLLWKRLRSALKIIVEGHNLTYAAHHAGFSDSAHLSRTFKSNFGLNLSKVFKNSQFIQFISL